MGIMAILNSMTALAYEEVKVLRVIEEEDMADIKVQHPPAFSRKDQIF